VSHLKHHKIWKTIPVITISASELTERELQQSLELGVLKFISRTLEPSDLINMINAICDDIKKKRIRPKN
jgi:hypothetical protein